MDNLKYGARRGRREFAWAVIGCVLAMTVVSAVEVGAAVKVTVETSDGVPGGDVVMTYALSQDAGDPTISSLQTDVLFHTAQLTLQGTCATSGAVCASDLDCCVAPCQGEQVVAAKGQCQNLPCQTTVTGQIVSITVPIVDDVPPPGQKLVRFAFPGVTDPPTFPPTTVPPGQLISCTFSVPASAQTGDEIQLSGRRLSAGDNMGNEVPVQLVIIPGEITTPTATPTDTPTATITPTPESTATPTVTIPATVTATAVSTDTPTVAVPTITPTQILPTNTATSGQATSTPTHTPTTMGGVATSTPTVGATRTPTSVGPTRTPTTASRAKNDDDNGCSMRPDAASQSGAGLWLLAPAVLLLGWRRRKL